MKQESLPSEINWVYLGRVTSVQTQTIPASAKEIFLRPATPYYNDFIYIPAIALPNIEPYNLTPTLGYYNSVSLSSNRKNCVQWKINKDTRVVSLENAVQDDTDSTTRAYIDVYYKI